MDGQQAGSDVIARVVALFNKQCAQSKQSLYVRRHHSIPRCDYVHILDFQWTDAEQKKYFGDGTLPDISRFDVESDGRSHWFFDITERWTALPQAKLAVPLDAVKIPPTMVLIGLEGKETAICFLSTEEVMMKQIAENEVQFVWGEDGRSSLYKPLENGYDLVEAKLVPKLFKLDNDADV